VSSETGAILAAALHPTGNDALKESWAAKVTGGSWPTAAGVSGSLNGGS
jgi:hypothetical protein